MRSTVYEGQDLGPGRPLKGQTRVTKKQDHSCLGHSCLGLHIYYVLLALIMSWRQSQSCAAAKAWRADQCVGGWGPVGTRVQPRKPRCGDLRRGLPRMCREGSVLQGHRQRAEGAVFVAIQSSTCNTPWVASVPVFDVATCMEVPQVWIGYDH